MLGCYINKLNILLTKNKKKSCKIYHCDEWISKSMLLLVESRFQIVAMIKLSLKHHVLRPKICYTRALTQPRTKLTESIYLPNHIKKTYGIVLRQEKTNTLYSKCLTVVIKFRYTDKHSSNQKHISNILSNRVTLLTNRKQTKFKVGQNVNRYANKKVFILSKV